MIGAIIGDIVGSAFEFGDFKSKEFNLFSEDSNFTDDTAMTVATAYAILRNLPYDEAYRNFYYSYPDAGYGGMFGLWCNDENQGPYNSFGNGSAMRVSPIGWIYDNLEETLEEAKKSAIVTHNHPEGIKGAQAIAAAIFLARTGKTKEEIKNYIEKIFSYELSAELDVIRPIYQFDETCPGSVPEAIMCFLESTDFEDAIRNAISLGGDSDTIACMAGSIAEAYYKDIPQEIIDKAYEYLNSDLISIINEFNKKFKDKE